MIKSFLTSTIIAGTIFAGGASVEANPIIQNWENARRNTTPEMINQPRWGGTTTLRQKCEAMVFFQRTQNWGKIGALAVQMGFEHDLTHLTPDEACAIVGVNSVF